ncbi:MULTISPECIES: UPF0158 family protein [unclassified Lacticaseibacillus]|uniref:UPF0158 family protein n=1 Tax=unclassified Lacticaseibacillus TaxID=2759744 RepID=UPI0019419F82|nr:MULTISPECIES: UPF0158 family protein [unclassified Lacticaseibacillus]
MPIKLSAVSEAIEMTDEELEFLYDREAGTIIPVPDDDDEAEALFEADDDERYVALPTQYDRDDYQLMVQFTARVATGVQRPQFERALHGRGVFKRFRRVLEAAGLLDRWYEFQAAAYQEQARQWCQANDIAYVE